MKARPGSSPGPGSKVLAIGRIILSSGGIFRLLASIGPLLVSERWMRRRARTSFYRSLVATGLPPTAARELSRHYPGPGLRELAGTVLGGDGRRGPAAFRLSPAAGGRLKSE